MDYNYVRMRNAVSRGDVEQAEKYRRLYEKGKSGADSHIIDVLIALLLVVSVALGIYISFTRQKSKPESAQDQPAVTAEAEEQPGYVTRPEAGGDEADNP